MTIPPASGPEKALDDRPGTVERGLQTGLARLRAGAYFEAHEALEEAWRAAQPHERDFFQGLVHVAVAWYQAGRGNRVGCERQLEKAARRLAPFRQGHRGLDVASLLRQVEAARGRFPALPCLRVERGPDGR